MEKLQYFYGSNEISFEKAYNQEKHCADIEIYNGFYGSTTHLSLTNKECIELINFLNQLSLNNTHRNG